MENQRISAEVAYVKSKNYLAAAKQGMIKAQKKGWEILVTILILGGIIGAIIGLLTGRPSAIIGIMCVVIALELKSYLVLISCRKSIKSIEYEMEKLRSGKVDPRDYYEKIIKDAAKRGVKEPFRGLSSSTGFLSGQEREMLSAFAEKEERQDEVASAEEPVSRHL